MLCLPYYVAVLPDDEHGRFQQISELPVGIFDIIMNFPGGVPSV